MPELYEFTITGSIGPMIQSCLVGFSPIAESRWTVLTGTAANPAELRRVLDHLDAHGTPVLDIRISNHEESGNRNEAVRSFRALTTRDGIAPPAGATTGSDRH